jgi:hypothetical protein
MTHDDAGKYGTKHPAGATVHPAIAAALKEVVEDGRVACVAAHDLAAELEATPAETGKTIDLLEYRIAKCQLGLFGYLPEKKIVKPIETVSADLRARLEQAATAGRIGCAECWEIARALGVQKIAVAAACENLGLRVKPCQLGAF